MRVGTQIATDPDGGVIPVPPVGALSGGDELIRRLALQYRPPTMHNAKLPVVKGGLSYGADPADEFRRGARDCVNHMLRGAKPGDLPVQFATRFYLVVNLKTAKAIGLTISKSFLLRADEVIE